LFPFVAVSRLQGVDAWALIDLLVCTCTSSVCCGFSVSLIPPVDWYCYKYKFPVRTPVWLCMHSGGTFSADIRVLVLKWLIYSLE
jgi:hypothetical protein